MKFANFNELYNLACKTFNYMKDNNRLIFYIDEIEEMIHQYNKIYQISLSNKYKEQIEHLTFIKEYAQYFYPNKNAFFLTMSGLGYEYYHTRIDLSIEKLREYLYSHCKGSINHINISRLYNHELLVNNKLYSEHIGKCEPEKIKEKVSQLKKEKADLEKLLNIKDNYEITNAEFFDLYRRFYLCDIEKLQELYYQKDFVNPKIFNVETDDCFSVKQSNGIGNNCSISKKYYSKNIKFYAEQSFNKENKLYTMQELKELHEQGTIFIVNTYCGKELTLDEYNQRSIKYIHNKYNFSNKKFEIIFQQNCLSYSSEMLKLIDKDYPFIFQTIRSSLNCENLQIDYKNYLSTYNEAKQHAIKACYDLKTERNQKITKAKKEIKTIEHVEKELNS